MLYYLDTAIVIYAVEGEDDNQLRAVSYLKSPQAAGHRFVISELSRTKCLAQVLGTAGGSLLLSFLKFFQSDDIRTLSLTTAMFDRGSAIRGSHHYETDTPKRYSLPDALHLAVAIESGCDVFLTNDRQLSKFPGIRIEVLP